MKHSNIAIFVPHKGCPHQCSFCNQKEITGQITQPSKYDVIKAVETSNKSLKENIKNTEIAFFGGSFTAIDRKYMIELLETASYYVKKYKLLGIRISTRPDAINEEILKILKLYSVTSIELGAQSMDDEVLIKNNRGHSVEDVINASNLIKKYKFNLGLQMMTGLYGSDSNIDYNTAKVLSRLKPDTMRIYPTVILENTDLCKLYESGKYKVMSFEDTVNLCVKLLEFFKSKNISVIRLGLHDSDSLKNNMIAGVFHPAFREICESKLMLNKCLKELNKNKIKENIFILVNPKSVSKLIGQKKSNLNYLKSLGYDIKIKQDISIRENEVVCYNNK